MTAFGGRASECSARNRVRRGAEDAASISVRVELVHVSVNCHRSERSHGDDLMKEDFGIYPRTASHSRS
jgi:hypothetical protein